MLCHEFASVMHEFGSEALSEKDLLLNRVSEKQEALAFQDFHVGIQLRMDRLRYITMAFQGGDGGTL